MLPEAYIVHQLAGRVRLRIKEKRQDPDYFAEACSRIDTLDGVTGVSANPNTGSLLLSHPDLPFAELAAQLKGLGLFEIVVAPATPHRSALQPVLSSFTMINEELAVGSSGSIDLRTLAVISLLGIALYQLYRGNVIGPAIPMLISAWDLARQLNNGPASPDV